MTAPPKGSVAPIWSLAEACAGIVDSLSPGGEGLCLAASAVFAHVIASHGVACTAVRGTYDGKAHWWLETGTHRVDVTRGQFDDGPVVRALAAGDVYVESERFPARWTAQQAVQEFGRAFDFGPYGLDRGQLLLDELQELATYDVGDWPAVLGLEARGVA